MLEMILFDWCNSNLRRLYTLYLSICGVGSLCKLQKGCTRLAAASDKAYQLLAHGRWFSPGTPASSTTKTGRHDIAEILLKVALKHKKSNQINLSICADFVWSLLIGRLT